MCSKLLRRSWQLARWLRNSGSLRFTHAGLCAVESLCCEVGPQLCQPVVIPNILLLVSLKRGLSLKQDHSRADGQEYLREHFLESSVWLEWG